MRYMNLTQLRDQLKQKPCNSKEIFRHIVDFKNDSYNALNSGHPEEVVDGLKDLLTKIEQQIKQ